MNNRIILHLDMNSYFASVEQQANPHLRGRPVGVCEHLGGIIIAPSVEAKRMGIKLGTPVWEAVKIFPQIALLPTDPDKYRHVTGKFLAILRDYSDDVEQYSIDEAFADITENCRGSWDMALLVGLEIKQRLRLEVGEWVSCSIGIGPNKLISKIAADLGEGDLNRIFVVRPNEVVNLYDRLELTDVPGIGPRLERALYKLGIMSLRQLADYPLSNLLNQFGLPGLFLHELANFQDTSAVTAIEALPKSFGHAYTVAKALTNYTDIRKLMFKLSEKVARRMRRHNARGSVVHYFHSDKQYSGFSKQRKIKEFINDGKDIFRVAWSIFLQGVYPVKSAEGRAAERLFNGVKIIGVSVSGLKINDQQDFLFEEYRRRKNVVAVMDRINNKYGDYTIEKGQMLDAPDEWGKDTVGFRKMR